MKMRVLMNISGEEKDVNEIISVLKSEMILEVSRKNIEEFDYKQEKIVENVEKSVGDDIKVPEFMTKRGE